MLVTERIQQAVAARRAEVSGTLYVAVSGGRDSMVLLEAVVRASVAAVEPGPVVVLHVNHRLRGPESDADEAFVRERAEDLGLEFRGERLSWQGEKPTQARCREHRRAFFRRALEAEGDRLFLAHHQDDQAETIFLHLLRGAGLRGLVGMTETNGAYVRPLLTISRAEIAEAAALWGLAWREDSSNEQIKYERNWLRREIFRRLEERRPGFATRLTALGDEAREATAQNEERFTPFDAGEGYTLARAAEVNALSGATLAHTYRLSRRHVRGLRGLLEKGAGKYEAEGVRFQLSAGCLLAESTGRLRGSVSLKGNSAGLRADSVLGTWHFPLGFAVAKSTGEKAKKAFQARRVPIFFRRAVPLAQARGRPEVLVPRAGETPETYEFQPSPLAAWWLNPNASSDDPGGPLARAETLP